MDGAQNGSTVVGLPSAKFELGRISEARANHVESSAPSEAAQPGSPNSRMFSPGAVRFRKAANKVLLSIQAVQLFTTLRDVRGINEIQTAHLTYVRKLGEGAFATVEECMYHPPGADAPRRVAVKRLKPAIMENKADLDAFLKEVALMRKLKNSHIIEYVGIGSSDHSSKEREQATMFLVEQFAGGGTLKQTVMAQMSNPHKVFYRYVDALRWALQVAKALRYLHKSSPKVIHRDLKLENLLLTSKDLSTANVKLSDFGLVALVHGQVDCAIRAAKTHQLMQHAASLPAPLPCPAAVTVGLNLLKASMAPGAAPGTTVGVPKLASQGSLKKDASLHRRETGGLLGALSFNKRDSASGHGSNGGAVLVPQTSMKKDAAALLLPAATSKDAAVSLYQQQPSSRHPNMLDAATASNTAEDGVVAAIAAATATNPGAVEVSQHLPGDIVMASGAMYDPVAVDMALGALEAQWNSTATVLASAVCPGKGQRRSVAFLEKVVGGPKMAPLPSVPSIPSPSGLSHDQEASPAAPGDRDRESTPVQGSRRISNLFGLPLSPSSPALNRQGNNQSSSRTSMDSPMVSGNILQQPIPGGSTKGSSAALSLLKAEGSGTAAGAGTDALQEGSGSGRARRSFEAIGHPGQPGVTQPVVTHLPTVTEGAPEAQPTTGGAPSRTTTATGTMQPDATTTSNPAAATATAPASVDAPRPSPGVSAFAAAAAISAAATKTSSRPSHGGGVGSSAQQQWMQKMSRVSKALSRAMDPTSKEKEKEAAKQQNWQLHVTSAIHQLSGQTGSFMYMAPEVYRQDFYNEKADVFSYGTILYELMHKYMMICAISIQGTPEEVQAYAERVSNGYRPPVNIKLPQELQDLIKACTEQAPEARPSMHEVVCKLKEIEASGVMAEMDRSAAAQMCCALM